MLALLDHTLLLCSLSFICYVSSYVARAPPQVPVQAAKTDKMQDASETNKAHWARITKGLHPRQLMDPDSNIAKYFANRPTSFSVIPYAPASVNNTEVCVLWDPNCKEDRQKRLSSNSSKEMVSCQD